MTGALRGNAFALRPHESTLSVFDPSICTPESLLLTAIKVHTRFEKSQNLTERIKAEAFFKQSGRTVNELLNNGWSVVGVPVSTLTEIGFSLSNPDPNGHIDVSGLREDFKALGAYIAMHSFTVLAK